MHKEPKASDPIELDVLKQLASGDRVLIFDGAALARLLRKGLVACHPDGWAITRNGRTFLFQSNFGADDPRRRTASPG
jgi:hypothetical protein